MVTWKSINVFYIGEKKQIERERERERKYPNITHFLIDMKIEFRNKISGDRLMFRESITKLKTSKIFFSELSFHI